METIADCERIVMFREGKEVPRFPSEPRLSSAARWKDVKLECHRLRLDEELAGVISGYQICFNLATPALVTWKIGGRLDRKMIQPGHLSIASHGHLRNVRWEATMDLLLFSLSTRLLHEFSAEISDGRLPELIEHCGHCDIQIQTLLRMLHSDLLRGSPAGSIYGDQLGTALAVYLMNRFAVALPQANQCGSGLPGMVLTRVLDYIESSLEKAVTLQELAEVARMSRFYFARLFRNSTGQSPSRYLTERRIERARYLLTRSDLSLEEISRQTGFSSQSHLTALFRKLVGVTPGKYRLLSR